MTLTEKAAYLKGMMEGMNFEPTTNEGKLLVKVIELLDEMALTVEDYEAYIAKLCEAYPDRSEAQIRAEHDPKAYAIEHYADYLAQALDGYVAACFKEVLTKE